MTHSLLISDLRVIKIPDVSATTVSTNTPFKSYEDQKSYLERKM